MQKNDIISLIHLSINVLRQGTLSKFKLFKQLFWTEVFTLLVFLFLFITQSPYMPIFQWLVLICGVLTLVAAYIMFRFHNGERIKALFILEEIVGTTQNPSREQLQQWAAEVNLILNPRTYHE